jgi:hypothetical protein
MMEDREGYYPHRSVQPQLLACIAINPAAASSSSLLQDMPPLSVEPSPITGSDFASRFLTALSPGSSAPTMTQTAPPFAATPFIESVGFFALLPVLCYSKSCYSMTLGSAAMHTDGSFDPAPFIMNKHFIYTLGEFTFDGPNWVTTLLPVRHLTHPSMLGAIAATLPLPLTDFSQRGKHSFSTGGRNSILIAPTDPHDESTLNSWFIMHSKFYASKAYTTRIEYTPPELRDEFHLNALTRWKAMRAANCQEREAREVDTPHSEPSPDADIAIWKGWLKHVRGHPQSKGNFIYVSIPLMGQGYQTAHITGTKQILALLPQLLSGAIAGWAPPKHIHHYNGRTTLRA